MSLLSPFVLVLPGETQTCLLRACLPGSDSVADSWTKWLAHVGDPVKYLKHESDGVKGMLPHLFQSLTTGGVALDPALQTYLKTARLTEEVRLGAYERICRDILTALTDDDRGPSPVDHREPSSIDHQRITAIVVGGADLAYTIYDEPVLRHTDGFDLVIADEEILPALEVLESLGCEPPVTPLSTASQALHVRHRSGLGISLHRDIFDVPFFVSGTEMRGRCVVEAVAGVPARILSPADNLLYVCANVFYGRRRVSLRWALDAWFLVRRYPSLDWDVLTETAVRNQMALPLFLTLRYVKDHLGASIPDSVLSRLQGHAVRVGSSGWEIAFSAVRRNCARGIRQMLRAAADLPTRARILRWMLFPTPSYLRWARVLRSNWQLPLRYLMRPLRYIADGRWQMEDGKWTFGRGRTNGTRPKIPGHAKGRRRSNDD